MDRGTVRAASAADKPLPRAETRKLLHAKRGDFDIASWTELRSVTGVLRILWQRPLRCICLRS